MRRRGDEVIPADTRIDGGLSGHAGTDEPFDIPAGTGAGESHAALEQGLDALAIGLQAGALEQHRLVPLQRERLERAQDTVGGAGRLRGGSMSSIRTSQLPCWLRARR